MDVYSLRASMNEKPYWRNQTSPEERLGNPLYKATREPLCISCEVVVIVNNLLDHYGVAGAL